MSENRRNFSFQTPLDPNDHSFSEPDFLIQFEEAIQERDQRLEQLEFDLSRILNEKKELEQKLNGNENYYKQTIAILEKNLNDLKENIGKNSKIIKDFDEHNKVLEEMLNICQRNSFDNDNIEKKDNKELIKKLKEKDRKNEQQIMDLLDKIVIINEEKEKLEKKINLFNKEKENSQNLQEKIKENNEFIQEKNYFLQIKDDFDKNKKSFEKEKNNFLKEKSDFENLLKKSNKENEEKLKIFQKEKSIFEKEKNNFENEKNNFEFEKNNFENEKNNLENEKNNFENEKNNFENEKNDFLLEKSLFDREKTEIKPSLEQNEEINEKLLLLEKEKLLIKTQKSLLEKEKTEYKKEVNNLKQEKEEFSDEKTKFNKEKQSLVEEKENFSKKMTEYFSKISNFDSEMAPFRSKLVKMESELSESKQKINLMESLEIENNNLKIEIREKDALIEKNLKNITKITKTLDLKEENLQKMLIENKKLKEIQENNLIKNNEINNNNENTIKLENIIIENKKEINLKNNEISKKNIIIKEKENEILKKNQLLIEKDNEISKKNQIISEKENEIFKKTQIIIEKEEIILGKEQLLLKKNQNIDQLSKLIEVKDRQIQEKNEYINEFSLKINSQQPKTELLQQELNKKSQRITQLELLLKKYNQKFKKIYNFLSKAEIFSLKADFQKSKKSIISQINNMKLYQTENIKEIIKKIKDKLEKELESKMLTIQKIYERKEEDYEKQLQKLSHESQILQMAIQNINQKSYTESFLEDKPQKLQEKPEKMVNTPVLKPGSFYLSALNRKKGPISPNLPLQTSQNSDIETIRGSLEYGSEITEVQDLKKNVSLLQEEHTKMISLIENVLKNDSKLDNSDFINNCFDKLFDQLTKSLEKAGELRVRINNLEDKINKNENYNKKESISNINDDSFKKLELENQQYKSLCKELQIQLDFKRAQMNFMQKETEKNKEIATKSSYLNSNENFNSEIISKPTNNNTNEFYNQISYSNEKKKEINLKQQASKISNYTITDRKANFFNKNKLVEVSRDYSESHNHGKIGNSQEIEIVPNISVNFLKNDNLTPNKKKDSKNIRRSPTPNKKSPFVNKDMYNAKWLN